ncbi:hypothetical protein D3C83_54020 [compost metagenome]
MCDVERSEHFERALTRVFVRYPGEHGKQRDVVDRVQERNEIRRLEDEPDAVAPQRTQIARQPTVVVGDLAAERDPPRCGLDDCAEAFE